MTKPKKQWRCQKCDGLGIIIPRAHAKSKICKWCAEELAAAGLGWCGSGRHAVPIALLVAPTYCKPCRSANAKQWRADHPDYTKEHNEAYCAAHRDELLAYNKQRYQENREAILAEKKEYYKKNAESIKAKNARHRLKRSEASKAKERLRQQQKKHIYRANEKLSRARRLLRLIRGDKHG